MSPKQRIIAAKHITRYHLEIASKRLAGKLRSELRTHRTLETYPEVTILVTTFECMGPLELTLRTLVKHTSYPNYRILVAHNHSTDGTIELIQELAEQGWPISPVDGKGDQWWWYDKMMDDVETPYWIGLHQDMYFLNGDWLADLVYWMEQDPEIMLLSGERSPARYAIKEPVRGAVVDIKEKPSTWIFCARKELRTHLDTSWHTHKSKDPETGRTQVYEQGGKVVEDMREKGLRYEWMPEWYARRYQHIGNLSWVFTLDKVSDAVMAYKMHQIRHVERRARSLRSAAPAFR